MAHERTASQNAQAPPAVSISNRRPGPNSKARSDPKQPVGTQWVSIRVVASCPSSQHRPCARQVSNFKSLIYTRLFISYFLFKVLNNKDQGRASMHSCHSDQRSNLSMVSAFPATAQMILGDREQSLSIKAA